MSINDQGERNLINLPEMTRSPKEIRILGDGNQISAPDGVLLPGMTLSIRGNNNKIFFGSRCIIKGGIYIKGNNCTVEIGEGTTVVGFRATVGEQTTLRIGKDCMFSRSIEVRTTDEHPIYDRTTRRLLNAGRDVLIGDHVWVGEGVRVNKGSTIPPGCVIGSRSLVSGQLEVSSASYAGIPARMVREDIVWARSPRKVLWEEG